MSTLTLGELDDTILAVTHALHACKMVGGDSMLVVGLENALAALSAIEAEADARESEDLRVLLTLVAEE
jgi:hypothetical protein